MIELTDSNAPMHSSRQLLAGAADAQRSNWKGSVSEVLPPAGWPVCVALGLLTLFLVLRTAATTFLSAAPSLQSYLLVMAASAVAAVAGRDVRAADASPVFARFSGATALGLAIYLLVEPTTYVSARPGTGALAATLRVGDACALVAAVVGLRRPTFLILPAVHVIAARYLAQTVSGLPMARHDVLYLAEAGIFMALAAITLKGVVRTQPVALAGARAYLANCFAFVAIGFHLASYFWSGVAKLKLSGEPFEWLLRNDVSKLLVVGIEKGIAPLAGVPPLAQIAHDTLSSGWLFFNGFVLAIQLLAVICAVRLLWLRLAAICYDLLHVGIYVFGGILFWPWIWINGAVLWALHGENDRTVGVGPKVCIVVCILACGLPRDSGRRVGSRGTTSPTRVSRASRPKLEDRTTGRQFRYRFSVPTRTRYRRGTLTEVSARAISPIKCQGSHTIPKSVSRTDAVPSRRRPLIRRQNKRGLRGFRVLTHSCGRVMRPCWRKQRGLAATAIISDCIIIRAIPCFIMTFTPSLRTTSCATGSLPAPFASR